MKNILQIIASGLILIGFLSGCMQASPVHTTPVFENAYNEAKQKVSTEKPTELIATDSPLEKQQGRVQLVQLPDFSNSDARKLQSASRALDSLGGLNNASGPIQINVERMPVYDFANLVFGELLNLNYAISPALETAKEKITLSMSDGMLASDFLPFVNELLQRYQIDVKVRRGAVYVDRAKGGSGDSLPLDVYWGDDLPALPESQVITHIFATRYVEPSKLLPSLKTFLGGSAGEVRTFVLSQPAGLVLSGPAGEVRRYSQLVRSLDRPFVAEKHIYLQRLEYIQAKEFVRQLKEIIAGMGVPIASSPDQVGLFILPIKSLNAVLLLSPERSWLERVSFWHGQIDTIEALGDEKRLFVIAPKNRSAAELYDVLKDFLVGASSTSLDEGPINKDSGANALKAVNKSRAATFDGPGFQVRMSVDTERNSLILRSTPAVYKNIRSIIEQLDTQPRQVLTEVTIAEVTLTGQLERGLEWFFQNSGSEYIKEGGTLDALGLGANGFNFLFKQIDGDFMAKINASASEDLINIISTPHLVVLDGHSATINVGTDVPIITSESTQTDLGGSILRNVQYRSTGTQLTVEPVISSSGMVTMKIGQSLSEAQSNNVSTIDSPIILKRSIDTILNLKSGETVLLGGLIAENKSTSENKVPWLGDVPGLGLLFRTDSEGTTKTELVIQITPYILNDTSELDHLTRAFRNDLF